MASNCFGFYAKFYKASTEVFENGQIVNTHQKWFILFRVIFISGLVILLI